MMVKIRLPVFFLLLPCVTFFEPCFADGGANQQEVIYQQLQERARRQAEYRQGRQVRITLLQPERWQQLPDCPVAPDIRFSELGPAGKITITLVCPATNPVTKMWKQRLAARIDFMISVLVAERDLGKGESLDGINSLTLSERAFSSVKQGFFHQLDELKGYITLRPVRAGTVITADLVKKSVVMRRGAPVTIIASSATVTLTTSGVAMENGRIGDSIPVKKDNSRVIQCQVMNAREVRPTSAGANPSP